MQQKFQKRMKLSVATGILFLAVPASAQFGGFGPTPIEEQTLPLWARGTRPLPLSELTFNQPPIWLIQSKVVGVEETDIERVTSAEITQVYAGPQTLLGQKWTFGFFKGGGSAGYYTLPSIKVGQEFLSAVKLYSVPKNPDKPTTPGKESDFEWQIGLTIYSHGYGLGHVAVLDGSPDALASLRQSQAVANVYNSPPEKLEEILLNYARQDTELTPVWAIQKLALLKGSDVANTFWQMAENRERPVSVQMALDEALLSLDYKHWSSSPARIALMTRLATQPLTATESEQVASFLTQQAQGKDAQFNDHVLDFLLAFLANPTGLKQDKILAASFPIVMVENKILSAQQALAFWNQVLRDEKLLFLAKDVTIQLVKLAPLSAEQQQNLGQTIAILEKELPQMEDAKDKQRLSDAIGKLKNLR